MGPAGVFFGDCLDVMRILPDASVDSIVCDPPYGIGFMGKAWTDTAPGTEVPECDP
jgi:DNA modification methylase